MRSIGHTRGRASIGRAWPLAAILVLAAAAPPLAAADDADPPSRVGRIALIEGSVSFHSSPDADWGAAAVNYPVGPSTAIFADAGGKAEVEIGEARVRLDGGTEVDVDQLDDQTVALSVPQGRVDVMLREQAPDEHFTIQTPRGTVSLLGNGAYRVFAGTDQVTTRVAVFSGKAELAAESSQLAIAENQEAIANLATPVSYAVAVITPRDAFDQWAFQRDATIVARVVPSYVPPVPGVATLSEYGDWRPEPQYGHVWIPRGVPAGWAPYHDGHWAFVAPWGWTWIDNAPWGFTPFHYGRWTQVGGAWGWIPVEPGVVVSATIRPVYAPALVAFIGNPGGLGISVGVGAVGWFPLGPGEVFRPWYHTSEDYVRRVNIVNVNRTVINNITINRTVVNENRVYANQRFATVVPQQAFARGEVVSKVAVRVPPEALTRPIEVARGDEAGTKVIPAPEPQARIAGGAHAVTAPPAPKLQLAHPAAASAAAFHEHPPAAQPAAREPAKPAEPAAAHEPVKPVEPAAKEPAKPGEPATAHEPAKSVEPAAKEPAKPGEPAVAHEPAKPGEPAARGAAKPGEPATAHEPGKPVEPAAKEPAKPGEPASAHEPAKPAEPAARAAAKPGEPATAHEPGKPVGPAAKEPAKPGEPASAREPAKPGEPAKAAPHEAAKPEAREPAKPAEPAAKNEHAQPAHPPAAHEAAKPAPHAGAADHNEAAHPAAPAARPAAPAAHPAAPAAHPAAPAAHPADKPATHPGSEPPKKPADTTKPADASKKPTDPTKSNNQ